MGTHARAHFWRLCNKIVAVACAVTLCSSLAVPNAAAFANPVSDATPEGATVVATPETPSDNGASSEASPSSEGDDPDSDAAEGGESEEGTSSETVEVEAEAVEAPTEEAVETVEPAAAEAPQADEPTEQAVDAESTEDEILGIDGIPFKGDGTEESPYLLESAIDLRELSAWVNGGNPCEGQWFKLTADVDLGGQTTPFTPIGYTTSQAFKGNFDGGGHTVSGLAVTITSTSNYPAGLFGAVRPAQTQYFRNVTVEGDIDGCARWGGGLVGMVYSGTVKFENIVSRVGITSNFSSNMAYFGGILGGYMSGTPRADFVKCANEGDISYTGTRSSVGLGGILGGSYYGSVVDCSNAGTITGTSTSYMGGLVGSIDKTPELKNSFNIGSIVAPGGYGKLCGTLTGSAPNGTGTNVFYLDTVYVSGMENPSYSSYFVKGNAKTADEMRSLEFARQLGSAFEYVEGSYPKPATWQPAISQQPQDKVVAVDAAAVLEVKASRPAAGVGADGTLSYQWYQCDQDGSNAGAVAGATEAAFQPQALSIRGEQHFYCEVSLTTNDEGCQRSTFARSAVATVKYANPHNAAQPVISKQPQGAIYLIDAEAAPLQIEASVEGDGAGDLSYQWYTCNADGSDARPVSGATENTLSIATATASSQYYFCEVTNTYDGLTQSAVTQSDVVCVTVSSEYAIATADDLRAFAQAVNGGQSFEGITVNQTADIDLKDAAWQPIGLDADHAFRGTYNGNGYTISGVAVVSDVDWAGLFGCVAGATIQNVVVQGAINCAAQGAAGIVGNVSAGSVLSSLKFDGSVSNTSEDGIAAGIACVTGGTVKVADSCFVGSVNAGAALVASGAGASAQVKNCFSYASDSTELCAGAVEITNSYYLDALGVEQPLDNGRSADWFASHSALLALGSAFITTGGSYPALACEYAAAGAPAIVEDVQDVECEQPNTVELVVQASSVLGDSAVSYQWYRANALESGAGEYVAIPGATSNAYAPEDAVSDYYYYCAATVRVDGAEYTALSNAAHCRIIAALEPLTPSGVLTPAAQSVQGIDQPQPIAYTAEGDEADPRIGTLSYQWLVSDTASADDAVEIAEATSGSYQPAYLGGTKYYFVTVTNTLKNGKTATWTSEAASVSVDNVVSITTADQLRAVNDNINAGETYAGRVIRLENDIDLGDVPWSSMGTFAGEFDGAYHTIKGFSSSMGGLFHILANGAVVQNLFLEGVINKETWADRDSYNLCVGSVANQVLGNGSMSIRRVSSRVNIDVQVEPLEQATSSHKVYVGGIAGYSQSATLTISECANHGNINAFFSSGSARPSWNVSGILGDAFSGSVAISDCYNRGRVYGNTPSGLNYAYSFVAGIASRTNVSNSYNAGAIEGYYANNPCAYSYKDTVNTYYLANSATVGTKGVITVAGTELSEAAMKAPGFAAKLNDAAFLDEQDDFPILAFEADHPLINSQPQGLTLAPGEKGVLSIDAKAPVRSGNNDDLAYEWFETTTDAPLGGRSVGNGRTLEVGSTTEGLSYYYCVVSSAAEGSAAQVVSDCAGVAVRGNLAQAVIDEQPVGGSYAADETFSLSTAAHVEVAESQDETVQGSLAYQWYVADDPNGVWQPVPGATDSTCATRVGDAGAKYYRCGVTQVVDGLHTAPVFTEAAEVTIADWVIASAQQMVKLADTVNSGATLEGKTVVLAADIDMSDLADWAGIGTYSTHAFKGTFDGGGHKVYGMCGSQGLFGYVEGATVKNVTVHGAIKGSKTNIGSIAGYDAGGSTYFQVGNCADITSTNSEVGGLVGQSSGSKPSSFERCFNAGAIQGTSWVSAFCDSGLSYPRVKDCYNIGSVTATNGYAIGIVKSGTALENVFQGGTVQGTTVYPFLQLSSMGFSNLYQVDDWRVSGTSSGIEGTTITREQLRSLDFVAQLNQNGAVFIPGAASPALAWQGGGDMAPVITEQPEASVAYVMGDQAEPLTFGVQLPEGVDGALSYQWYETEGLSWSASPVAVEGATGAQLQLDTSSLERGQHYYYCEAVTTYGDADGANATASTLSSVATVTIRSNLSAVKPQLSAQPQSAAYQKELDSSKVVPLSVEVGNREAEGFDVATYQWYRAYTPEGLGYAILGAVGATYTPSLDEVGTRYYYCVVTNTFDGNKTARTRSDAAAVQVYNAYAITPVLQQNLDTELLWWQKDSDLPELSVGYELPAADPGCGGTLSYEWYRSSDNKISDDDVLQPEAHEASFLPQLGADEIVPGNTYYYYCKTTNTFTVLGEERAVTVTSALKPIYVYSTIELQTPQVTNNAPEARTYLYTWPADALSIQVENKDAAGMGDLTYVWYAKDAQNPSAPAREVSKGSTSYTPDTAALGAGVWDVYCTVTNTFETLRVASADSVPTRVTVNNTLTIHTKEDFEKFRDEVNGGKTFAGMLVELYSDIDLEGSLDNQWTPVGTTSTAFKGTFDGRGHTVKGLYIAEDSVSSSNTYLGLFRTLGAGATVRNLVVDGSVSLASYTTPGTPYIGGVVGSAASTVLFENVGSTVSIDVDDTANNATYGAYVGGLCGYASDDRFEGCFFAGSITSKLLTGNVRAVGGIVGRYDPSQNARMVDCYNAGTIAVGMGSSYAGGLIGWLYNSSEITLTNCVSAGSAQNCYAIAGSVRYPEEVTVERVFDLYGISDRGSFNADNLASETVLDDEINTQKFCDGLVGGTCGFALADGRLGLSWQTALREPSITGQPADIAMGVGQQIELTVQVAEGDADGLSYQWYEAFQGDRNGVYAVAGAAAASIDLSALAAGKHYLYCEVSRAVEGQVLTARTRTATIAVTENVQGVGVVFEGVQQSAEDVDQGIGESNKITVAPVAADSQKDWDALTYEWFTVDASDENAKPQPAAASLVEIAADGCSSSFDTTGLSLGSYRVYCVVTHVYEGVVASRATSVESTVVVNPRTLEISTAEELAALATSGMTYEGYILVLTDDIDLSAVCSEEKGSWTPIPDFRGVFDGQGHAITGLYINSTSTLQGLFAVVTDAVLKNFTVDGYVYSSKYYVAGVAAQSTNSLFQNVGNRATVVSAATSRTYGGAGIVSRIIGGTTSFEQCFNTGSINANGYAAGIASYSTSTGRATFLNCYNSGSVAITSGSASGIGYSGISAENCYNSGVVTGPDGYIDALVFSCDSNVNIYSSASVSDESSCYYGTILPDEEMRSAEFVDRLNNGGNAFEYNEGGYPRLAWEVRDRLSVDGDSSVALSHEQNADAASRTATFAIRNHGASNLGNLTVQQVSGADVFDVALSDTSVAAGQTVQLTVTTKSGVAPAVYQGVFTVSADGADAVQVDVTATVTAMSSTEGDPGMGNTPSDKPGQGSGTPAPAPGTPGGSQGTTTVVKPSLASASVKVTGSYVYNGKSQTPVLAVTLNGATLVAGRDYTVVGSGVKAGTYKVTVMGLGNYTGSAATTFTIAKAQGTLAFASKTVAKAYAASKTFTLKATKGTCDGAVTYTTSNKKVATVNSKTGKVTIKGLGTVTIKAKAADGANYKGATASYKLTVKPKAPALSSLKAAKKGFTVKWTKPTVKGTTVKYYQIRYSTKSTMAKAKTVKVSAAKLTKLSRSISKLTGKKKYYVQIRAYTKVGSKSAWSNWSAKKTVKTK